jgi:polyisoprenoid-binding protein YceI
MLRTVLVSLALGCVSSAGLAWDLQADASTVNFVSIKKNNIGELHRFKQVSGHIDKSGKAELTIALDSVDTSIPVRDDNMRKFLFETASFPTARYEVTVDPAVIDKLACGDVKTLTLDGSLSLHGQTVKVPAKVAVLKTNSGQLQVNTVEPILVNAEQFGMAGGVAKLMEVVNLPALASVAPVTFSLTFTDKPAKAAK